MIGLRILYLYILFFFLFLFAFPSHPDVEWYLLLFFCFGHPVLIFSIFEGFDSVNLWLPSLLFWIAFFYIVISYFKDLKRKDSNKRIFTNEYRIRDTAIKEIRSMYFNGTSPLDIIKYIRQSDLITPNDDTEASIFFVECFSIGIGYSKIGENFLTSKNLHPELIAQYNGVLKEQIELRKLKWIMDEMFSHFYSKKDNAIEEIHSMYSNGSSALEMLQNIRSSDLISPNSDTNTCRFFIECFSLALGDIGIAHPLISKELDATGMDAYNKLLEERIEAGKSKWYTI
jgi:hypothetical protein